MFRKLNAKRIGLILICCILTVTFGTATKQAFAASDYFFVGRNTSRTKDASKSNYYQGVPANNRGLENWAYWSQGGSKYYKMANWGCHLVAYAKLLAEVGCNLPDGFDPDYLLKWAQNTKHDGRNVYVDSGILETNVAGFGMLPVAYARTRHFDIELMGGKAISLPRNKNATTDAQKKENRIKQVDKIMKYLNAGYYVILGCDQHFTYILRDESLKCGYPVLSDSRAASYGSDLVGSYVEYVGWTNMPDYSIMLVYRAISKKAPTPTPLPRTYGTVTLGLQSTGEYASGLSMNIGDSTLLGFKGAAGYNRDTDAQSIEWSSENPNVASVNSSGRITALKAGNTKIKFSIVVKSTNTLYTGEMALSVRYPVTPTPTPLPATELVFTMNGSNQLNLMENDTFDLDTFHPWDYIPGEHATMGWKSASESTVAILDGHILKALKPGTCPIKFQAEDSEGNKYEGKFYVNVTKLTLNVMLSRMDNLYDMASFMMENADYDDTVEADYIYTSKSQLVTDCPNDVEDMQKMDTVIVALPASWELSDFEELMNTDLVTETLGGGVNYIQRGRVRAKKDDLYYYIIVDMK